MRLDCRFVRWVTASAHGRHSRAVRRRRKGCRWPHPATWIYGSGRTLAQASTSPVSSMTTGSGCSPGAVSNDQPDLEALLDPAAQAGTPELVIDQPSSIA